jgi:lambda repressor-like predicted transcriptional regulator
VRPALPRLPLEPLVRRYGSVRALSEALSRDRAQVQKWRERGVTVLAADDLAVALGLHPVEVWPEWYEISERYATAA